ncbi:PDCD5-related protein [Halteromyces radiatus]|uniref:PDCD5-related protein n=1 Tax=Halteromyces radiatus TaxID=101107 RepID=UPI00221E443A|nr:PDCD5-related protein [Halteromyces radiatus]KAI8082918.1 PDCD5-related protein [Halteromyces radiatus]
MADDELQAIRARRLAELQQQGSGNYGGSPSSGLPSPGAAGSTSKEDEEKQGQIEEMRRTMLFQILDNNARERLARIQMVKAEKARAVEDLLIRMAQSNQLRNKVTESQLIDLLGQINQQESGSNQSRVVFERRRFGDDSDDEEYDL